MRKWICMGAAILSLVVAGLLHAHSGDSHPAASGESSDICPLQAFVEWCHQSIHGASDGPACPLQRL